MSTCRLIVCEKSSHWAAALRGSLAGERPAVREVRSLAHVERALVESSSSVVALEVSTANLEAVLVFLERAARHFDQARFVGLVASGLAQAAPLLREAGAIDVLVSVVEIKRLARLAQRHHAIAPPADPRTMRQFVAERLPWPAYASQS
jgi:DNA-binding NtrC family response regulator